MGEELEITMLGGFVIKYLGEPLKLERSNTTRAMHALQLLIYHGAAGMSRRALMDALYGREEDMVDPANNLKVTISNLRRILGKAGLPPTTTIKFSNGSYYWATQTRATLDVQRFALQASAARACKDELQRQQLEEACRRYTGDFLPHLQSEDWAMAAAVRYREEYCGCVQALAQIYQQQGLHSQLLQLASRASALCPREEWDVLRIESLLAMQRYGEAKTAYEETVMRLQREFGVEPSAQLTECLRRLQQAVPGSGNTIEQLQGMLKEEKEGYGAYYCPFSSFIDTYRTVSRMLERTGQSAYLMMCWLADRHGRRMQDKQRVAQAMGQLGAAIQEALRRGDTYTQPGSDRFLVLLMGINRENCTLVGDRISTNYHAQTARRRGVHLYYNVTPVSDRVSRELLAAHPAWQ